MREHFNFTPEQPEKKELKPQSFSEQNMRRIDSTKDYLGNPEKEVVDSVEALGKLHDIETVLSTAAILLTNPETIEKIQDLKETWRNTKTVKTYRKNFIVEGDDEGSAEFEHMLEQVMDAKIAFFNECISISSERFPSSDQLGIEIAKLRVAQELMVERLVGEQPPEILRGFPPEVMHTILENTQCVVLTEGCSVGCNFCAFSEGKLKNAFAFRDAAWIASKTRLATLYRDSDPLDYVASDDPRKTYSDEETRA